MRLGKGRIDVNRVADEPPKRPDHELLEELRAIRREQAALRRLLDSFCGAYLAAKFPYGDHATDRWGRRR
jgi:hypothetical protein